MVKKGLFSTLRRAVSEVTYGAALHGQVSAVLKTRMYIEHMFILMILGDMLGFPILPPPTTPSASSHTPSQT
jgi:hypothetical protein